MMSPACTRIESRQHAMHAKQHGFLQLGPHTPSLSMVITGGMEVLILPSGLRTKNLVNREWFGAQQKRAHALLLNSST